MSNALAVSILAKLGASGEWWTCDGNLNGSRNGINISNGLSLAGYEAGLNHQRLKSGSFGYANLAAGTVDASTAITIGGRFTYDGASSTAGCISVGDGFSPHNEVLAINVNAPLSLWGASSWASDPTNYGAMSGAVGLRYPITVRVTDSLGNSATSSQAISILTPGGLTAGASYDVFAIWDADDTLKVVVDGVLRATSTLPRPAYTKTGWQYFQIGNQYLSSTSPVACEGLCYARASFTVAECAYIYNSGARKTYADIVADAA